MFGGEWGYEGQDRLEARADLLNELEQWLRAAPYRMLTFRYVPGGLMIIPGDREMVAGFDPPIGSKHGMANETLEELVAAIVRDAP